MRRLITSFTAGAALALASATLSFAGNGPPQLGLIVDGQAYRTVGTPTDFSNTGAPASSFDNLYQLGGDLLSVAAAAPGDSDFNGGRWMVFSVTWNVEPYQIQSEEEVLAAAAAGQITISADPVKEFECPVIPAH
jgi:hypothetical protein